jgi:hypothetical protein
MSASPPNFIARQHALTTEIRHQYALVDMLSRRQSAIIIDPACAVYYQHGVPLTLHVLRHQNHVLIGIQPIACVALIHAADTAGPPKWLRERAPPLIMTTLLLMTAANSGNLYAPLTTATFRQIVAPGLAACAETTGQCASGNRSHAATRRLQARLTRALLPLHRALQQSQGELLLGLAGAAAGAMLPKERRAAISVKGFTISVESSELLRD